MSHSPGMHALQAKLFAALSAEAIDYDPERSILLGMHALNATLQHGEAVEHGAEQALRQAIWQSRLRLALKPGGAVTDSPTCLSWNNDGTRLVTSISSNEVIMWDPMSGERLWSYAVFDAGYSAAFSPDGKQVATGRTVLDAVTGTPLRTMGGDQPWAVAWSPDSKRLALGTLTSVAVWDVDTAALLVTLRSAGTVGRRPIAWSPDGKRIATATTGVQLWDAATGAALETLGPQRDVSSIAWSPDGKLLAVGGSQYIPSATELWDTSTGVKLASADDFALGTGCVVWSPDGQRLARGDADGAVKVYGAADGRLLLTLKGHVPASEPCLAWSPDGTRLATGPGWNGAPPEVLAIGIQNWAQKLGYISIKVWDTLVDDSRDGQELLTLREATSVSDMAWSPDGTRIAIGSEKACKILDAENYAELWRAQEESAAGFSHLCWSPDGAWLVATEITQDAGNRTRIWHAPHGEELLALPSATSTDIAVSSLSNVCWSADGKRVAAMCTDTATRVWDIQARQLLLQLGADVDVLSLDLRLDGKRLATGAINTATVRIWDIESGQLLMTLGSPEPLEKIHGQELAIKGLAWCPHGERLFAMAADYIRCWDMASGTEVMRLTMPPNNRIYNAYVVSPDRKRLAVIVDDNPIQVFGGTIGGAKTDRWLSLWNLENGEQLPQPEFLKYQLYLNQPAVQWHPDGRQLATAWATPKWFFGGSTSLVWGTADRSVRVIDADSGTEMIGLRAMSDVAIEAGPVPGMAWRPDGKRFAWWSGNRVQIHVIGGAELLALARTRVTRNFTFDEGVRYFNAEDAPPIP